MFDHSPGGHRETDADPGGGGATGSLRDNQRRARRREIRDALLAVAVVACTIIAVIAVTGLVQDGDGGGIAEVAPADEVLKFFGLREDDATLADVGVEKAAPDEPGDADGGTGAGDSADAARTAFPVGFTSTAAAALKATARPILVAPLAGETAEGHTFEGTLYIERFAVRDGVLFVLGRVTGTLRDANGEIVGAVEALPVRLPATLRYEDGELVIELGELVLGELGVTVELQPLVADAAGQPGSQRGLFVEQIDAVAELVAGGASVEAIADELNSFIGSAGTPYSAATGSVSELGSDPATETDGTTPPSTGATSTPTETAPTTSGETPLVDGLPAETPAPPTAGSGGPEACPPNLPVAACETASR